MTVEVNIDVETGPVSAIPVPVTAVDYLVINAPCRYCGYSLREAGNELPVDAEGSVTSPAANQVIAQLTGLPAGTYTVNWEVSLAGTLAAADANNFGLTNGAETVTGSVNPAVAGSYPQVPSEIVVTAGSTVAIEAGGAGTAGAIYSAQISLTPVIVADAVVEIRDGNQPLAVFSAGAGGSETEYSGKYGVKVMSSITVHVVQGTVTGVVYVTLGY